MGAYKYTNSKGQLRWLVKFQQNGTSIYKRGFTMKRDAADYEYNCRKSLRENGGGTPATAGVPSTSVCDNGNKGISYFDVYTELVNSYKNRDLKESSLQTKQSIFDKHIFPKFKDVQIDKITTNDIAAWQDDVRKNGFSEAYLRTIQAQFNTIINYALAKGYIKVSPLIDIKNMGVKTKRIEFWTPDQYQQFSEICRQFPRYYLPFEILFWCGLREGEMLALTIDDIDFDKNIITVNKTLSRVNGKNIITSPKTESSIRKVVFPEFLAEELRNYIDMLYNYTGETRLFFVEKTMLSKKIHEISDMCGLPHITVHGLRHSHVSLLISKGYDIFEISKRIGHKSVAITQDTYGHLFDTVQRNIANDLNSIREK